MDEFEYQGGVLISKIRRIIKHPPPGVTPWKGKTIESVIDSSRRFFPDQGAFFHTFLEGCRDLAEGVEEDKLLQRFSRQNLFSESAILADALTVRDHLAHVCQVFLCGWAILNGTRMFRYPEKDWHPYGWSESGEELFVKLNRAWLFAALLHDSAYSLEYAKSRASHGQRVAALFSDLFQPGSPDVVKIDEIERTADAMWSLRKKWLINSFTQRWDQPAIKKKLNVSYERIDHAIVGGVKLWKEAEIQKDANLRDILFPAAVAVASHDFKWGLELSEAESSPTNQWFSLDLYEEPLSALLVLCDELQEWSRERQDGEQVFAKLIEPYHSVVPELTRFDIDDSTGISVSERLLLRVHQSDREFAYRIRRDEERDNAEKSRTLQRIFSNRVSHPEFSVSAFIEKSVDDIPCLNEIAFGYVSRTVDNRIAELHEAWATKDSIKKFSGVMKELRIVDNPFIRMSIRSDGMADLHITPNGAPLRLVLVGPGGTGKSVLLQAVARNRKHKGIQNIWYLRDLGDHLFELFGDQSASNDDGNSTLLLVDHIDRMTDHPNGEFWLEQFASLPQHQGPHVVCACRTDEYDRYVADVLKSAKFVKLEIEDAKCLLTNGDNDKKGRALALAIEKLLRPGRYEHWKPAAKIAVAMGSRRRKEHVSLSDADPKKLVFAQNDEERAAFETTRGSVRFCHDTIHDFLSAAYLAQMLAHLKDSQDPSSGEILRELEKLPRDVPRLLFDYLAATKIRWLSAQERENALIMLGKGLIQCLSLQQWLYDTGRLDQAHFALEKLEPTVRHIPITQIAVLKLIAHVRFSQFNWADTIKTIPVVDDFAEVASCAENLISTTPETEIDQGICNLLLFSIQHICYCLTRLRIDLKSRHLVKETAHRASEKLIAKKDPKLFAVGWGHQCIKRMEDEPDWTKITEGLEYLYKEIEEKNERAFDVRLAILAGHIANVQLEWARHNQNDTTALENGIRWYEKSIYLKQRVCRQFALTGPEKNRQETVVSLTQGHSDIAHQYRGIFECLLLQYSNAKNKRQQVARLIECYHFFNDEWKIAERHRQESERLSFHVRPAMAALAIGKTLEDILTRSISHDNAVKIRDEIKKNAADTLKRCNIIAERNPRFSDGGDIPERMLSHFEKALGKDLGNVLLEMVDQCSTSK